MPEREVGRETEKEFIDKKPVSGFRERGCWAAKCQQG
jgi:hypothetical protein